MTNEELQKEMEKARRKIDSMLQMPPVINVRKPINQIFSKDPALQGLETSRMVFTDITFGLYENQMALYGKQNAKLKRRINQLYFPKTGRSIVPPRLFEDSYLESLLNRQEYEFILDSACMQFEPDDPDYQRVVSIVYQHINDNNNFEILRSTRHFGVLTFFLVWNKSIDNLLLDLIETAHIEEAGKLIELYYKVHNESVTSDSDLEKVDEYVRTFSNKKGALELSLQAYKDLARQREELEKGIKIAHGLN
ncbi:hypothetical protein NQ317_000472 [Molorchus minor]|uniref:Uncharacterized protein n=1 Tax=Molorchus minor TaxID=1323400 RepID=A0ABQ9IU50_9CUCU|nr:hypothetical protein NQ317_000472 [Molorchus minor]